MVFDDDRGCTVSDLQDQSVHARPLDPWAIRIEDRQALSNWRIICLSETRSTNDVGRRYATHAYQSCIAIFADWQSAGRGQSGRRWIVPPGLGLLGTTIWHPLIQPCDLQVIVQLAGVAVVDTLASMGIHAGLKWPNDIMIDGSKCGGILVESSIEGSALRYVAIGIGLNVLQTREQLPPATYPATSLLLATGHAISRTRLAARLLSDLESLNNSLRDNRVDIFARWKRALSTIGQDVHLSTRDGPVSGQAEDVHINGALVVRTEDRGTIAILNGEILQVSTTGPTRP